MRSSESTYDAIVVGSGASGSWAAKELTEGGLNVVLRAIHVTGGACFVSSGFQNPTLTMMALTVRACRFIVRDYVKCAN